MLDEGVPGRLVLGLTQRSAGQCGRVQLMLGHLMCDRVLMLGKDMLGSAAVANSWMAYPVSCSARLALA
jgi:hypothetical protein